MNVQISNKLKIKEVIKETRCSISFRLPALRIVQGLNRLMYSIHYVMAILMYLLNDFFKASTPLVCFRQNGTDFPRPPKAWRSTCCSHCVLGAWPRRWNKPSISGMNLSLTWGEQIQSVLDLDSGGQRSCRVRYPPVGTVARHRASCPI